MPRDLDNHGVFVVACPDEDPAASVQGIDGVINQICPHLIQLRPIRLNSWQALVILADDLDSGPQLVTKDQERLFDAFVHSDLLLWSSVHVRVLFDGRDELCDATQGVVDLIDETRCQERRRDPVQTRAKGL